MPGFDEDVEVMRTLISHSWYNHFVNNLAIVHKGKYAYIPKLSISTPESIPERLSCTYAPGNIFKGIHSRTVPLF